MNIDREIAEKVMGWETRIYNGMRMVKPTDLDKGSRALPNFSTNIQHAMEVEAEMFRRGWEITMKRGGKVFWAEFQKDDVSKIERCYAKSLPEAICLAALETMEKA